MLYRISLALFILAFATTSEARNRMGFQVGGGIYQSAVQYDDYRNAFIEFLGPFSLASSEESATANGTEATLRFIATPYFAIEGNHYFSTSIKCRDYSDKETSADCSSKYDGVKVSGSDINLIFSDDFFEDGFYGYSGLGYYVEERSGNGTEAMRGFQLPLGFGIKFGPVALDLQVAIKESGDYHHEEYPDHAAYTAKARILATF